MEQKSNNASYSQCYLKMSKESVCTKNTIQPCITSLLSPSAEPVEPNVTPDNTEVTFQSVKQKKRKRPCKSGDQTDNNPSKKNTN